MKKITLLLSLALCLVQAVAQQKLLSIEDAVLKQRTTLAPERLSQLQWIPNTPIFSYVGKKNAIELLITQDATDLNRDTVLLLADFNTALQNLLPNEKAMNRFPFLTWVNKVSFRFFYQNAYYLFTFNDMRMRLLASAPKNAENLDFDPTSNKLAYTLNYNLFVNTVPGAYEEGVTNNGDVVNKKDLITTDGNMNMQYGSSAVHRNEFGITKGTFFSPKGNRIAFYKLSESMVSDYELMDVEVPDTIGNKLTKPTSFKRMKYPMAGNVSHHAKVMLYDFKRKQVIEVTTEGDPEQFLTNVSWSADEEYLFIAVLNRAQNEMKLNMYDGSTGAFIKTLFTETHPKYVEPEKGPYFINNDNSKFIWFSERNGYNHLYLYSSRGTLIKQLSTGNISVSDIIGNDPSGNILYYHAYSEDGLNKHVYRLDIKSNTATVINKLPGQHIGLISTDGKLILENLSSVEIPKRVLLMNDKGAELNIIFNSINPIRDYAPCKINLLKLNSPDGKTKLNARMILPHNFDSTKKYPVVVYVYGGPHAQMISNTWLGGADMWLYYMAQQGYITFTVDNRGSGNRGFDFENAIHRNLGKVEMEDQLAGVNYLKTLKYVDANRLGVFGWSFGGFMSTSLMTKTPDVFKVGVAGGPVIDWRFYEIMYTERYMDTPQENPEGYANADLKNYAKNLKGKLLLIHGTNDNVVLWQHTLSYLKKCVEDGVLVDYFVYPGHEHNVLGKDRVHLMKKVSTYFKDYL
jgi:dipeptidyl-peptidase-4